MWRSLRSGSLGASGLRDLLSEKISRDRKIEECES
jgi:hypothetical protein